MDAGCSCPITWAGPATCDPSTRQLLQPGQWTHLPFDRTRMVARRLAAGSRLLVKVDVLKDAMHQVNHGTGRDVSDESAADAGAPLQVDWHSDSVLTIPLHPTSDTPSRATPCVDRQRPITEHFLHAPRHPLPQCL